MSDSVPFGASLPGALKRPRFEADDWLAAGDLAAEQEWRRQRLRRHNRHLHGWGVVCGLWVVPGLEGSRPWGLVVCPGYALGPYGDEILVGCPARVDLREWVWSRPSTSVGVAYIAIRHAEAASGPRAYQAADCGCGDDKARNVIVSEKYRIDVLWSMPDPGTHSVVDLCHDVPPCGPCPPTPYVLLAAVRLPPDEGTVITRPAIDMSVRRTV